MLARFVKDYVLRGKKTLKLFFMTYCFQNSQVVLTGSQIMWCRDMTKCLLSDGDRLAELKQAEEISVQVCLWLFKTYPIWSNSIPSHISLSHSILFHILPSHFIAFYPISFHFISFHPTSSHSIPFNFIPSHFILFNFIPFHSIPFHLIPSHFIPSRFISFHFIPSHFIPSHIIPFHFIPSHSISFHRISLISPHLIFLIILNSRTWTSLQLLYVVNFQRSLEVSCVLSLQSTFMREISLLD